MLNELNLKPMDLIHDQTVAYTFIKKYKSLVITSWIDHVFTSNETASNFKFMKIMANCPNNVSDHLPMKFIYKLT